MYLRSPSYYRSPNKEIDQKEVLISKLNEENIEIRGKERNIEKLRFLFTEAEKEFKLLHEESVLLEREQEIKKEQEARELEILRAELKQVRQSLEEKSSNIRSINAEVNAWRKLSDSKKSELSKAKNEFKDLSELNMKFLGEKNTLTAHLGLNERSINQLIQQLESLKSSNFELTENKLTQNEKILQLKENIELTSIHLSKAKEETLTLSAQKRQLLEEFEKQREERVKSKSEIEKLSFLNSNVLNDNARLVEKSNELEFQKLRLEENIINTKKLIELKEKEIVEIKSHISYSESKKFESNFELEKLQKEKESLELLMIHYKEDADKNKIQRNDIVLKSIEIENQKKSLQSLLAVKEIETYETKKNIEKVAENKSFLAEEHLNLSRELEAMKDHTSVLEKQNMNLNHEIENITTTDELVRRELDRKNRLELLKSKDEEELKKSIAKVSLSKSPPRFSPIKTAYSNYK